MKKTARHRSSRTRSSLDSSWRRRRSRLERLEARNLLAADIGNFQVDFDAVEPSYYSQAEILVRFEDGFDPSTTLRTITQEQPGPSFLPTALGDGFVADSQLFEIPVVSGALIPELVNFYNSLDSVEYAEPNYLAVSTATPNDTNYSDLWGHENINAPDAWNTRTDSSPITVAIIDSGVDYDHPDLNDNIWRNTDEIAGNGIDDDGNGYVDDHIGWDFQNNNNDPSNSGSDHGTHVAGIVGAEGNNNRGVTGVGWNASLMALEVIGTGTFADIARAVDYATDNGAKITNNSYETFGNFIGRPQVLTDAIDRARDSGVLFIAAAGNRREGLPAMDVDGNYNVWPAEESKSLDNVIAVGSIDEGGGYSVFANWGPESVQIAAPGGSILSTVRDGRYDYLSGTSMAAPQVAGAAALLWAQDPSMTYLEVKDLLLSTARREQLDRVGSGVLDLGAAMAELTATSQAPFGGSTRSLTSTIQAEDFDTGGQGVAYNDTGAENIGGEYRPNEGVDITTTPDAGGGHIIGWNNAGEWTEYTVNASEGTYDIEVRAASNISNPGDVQFSLNGQTLATVPVEGTRGWQSFQTFRLTGVSVPAASDGVLRMTTTGNGSFNVNWFRFVASNNGEEINLGNDPSAGASLDGWNSNIVINKTDTYTNDSGASQAVSVEQFAFHAGSNASPVTPFLVRVNGDDDFTVLAVGTTRTNYARGNNTVAFADGNAPTVTLNAGQTLAVGFLDANADGSGSTDAAITFNSGGDDIWYSGSSGSDSGSVSVGSAPTPGPRTLNLNRDYQFTIGLSVLGSQTAVELGNGPSAGANLDGWNSNLVVNETDTYTNNSGSSQTVTVEQFAFHAGSNASPLTPFLVRVNGDNDFTVLAVGTTRTNYATGNNTVAFADGAAPTVTLGAGQTVAIGFLDANADGSGSTDGAITFNFGGDEIWYSGSSGSDSGSVRVGSAPTPGPRALNLNRDYQFTISMQVGSALQVLGSSNATASQTSLTDSDLASQFASAQAYWADQGYDTALLNNVNLVLTNLGGNLAGLQSGNTVYIDDDAAGLGWYVDDDVTTDESFSGIDLFTTIAHELGHVLGLNDQYDPSHADDLMYGFIEAGERRASLATGTDVSQPVDQYFDLFANSDLDDEEEASVPWYL